jgi:capsular polysaccharide biosynthesis protein
MAPPTSDPATSAPTSPPGQMPDGDAPARPATRSTSAPSSARAPDQEAPSIDAGKPPAAASELFTIESEHRGIALAPRDWARFGLYAVVIVLAASLAGYLFGSLGDTVRAARSEVLYQLDAERPTGFLRQDRQLTTQLVTIRSRALLAPVAEEYGLSVDDLSSKLDVSVAEDSEVIRIEVQDRSAARARALADAITREYLARTLPGGAAEARQYLEDQLSQLDQQQGQLAARLTEVRSTAEQTALTAELQSLLTQRVQLQSRLEEVAVEQLRGPQVEEITNAYALPDPVSPMPGRAAMAGALAGLLVAAIAVAILVRRRMSAVDA